LANRPAARNASPAPLAALALAGALALASAFAAPAARAQGSDEWTVWMGPNLSLARPLGDFEKSNPKLALGGGFTAVLLRTDARLGVRFDMGLAGHGKQTSEVVLDDGYDSTLVATLETSSRLSWGMLGAQWDANPRGNAVYGYAMIGIEGWRPQVKALTLRGVDPALRPESNRGFAWSAGIGARYRRHNSGSLAFTTELEYRQRGAANYIGSPAYDTSGPLATYRGVHGAITSVSMRVGVTFTKFQ